ncbi:hypothetical protein BT93_L1532 [Corymbia citriodora subsp. variegata]|uniref:TIR domain-containing protein n=1 Tax=Corymbia citriodora subsp. variegata TaxID=360336 RepID=A0A8T0CNN3_CORYI|nr:hypothetical protein BT93_L1532 [Corymbia citriodora subsp. variegata]
MAVEHLVDGRRLSSKTSVGNCQYCIVFYRRESKEATPLINKQNTRKHSHLHFPKFQANTPAPSSLPQILMASSSTRKRNYDVFLSFRGTDVRKNFLGHLYTALNQNGIFIYINNEELRKGEQLTLAPKNAIEQSCIAIIVFSKDYASSPWCLEEAVKIMECKERKGLIVLPVFYKVEPRELRRGRKSYGKAMAKHESKFGKDSKKVKRWAKALFDAGGLSGWDLNDGDEVKLIKRIVEEISMQLNRTPLHVGKHLVGIHRQVEKLESMLNLKSDDVLMIGLWGPGGIGKTTLAKALYNAIFRQFQGSCFLANVQEASKDSKDLVPLQEKLLKEILLGKTLAVYSVDGGINLMQDRLCYKKVLLVLDDVNDIKQLNALAGECEWFGKGSRIIITTRDSHLLTFHGIDEDHIYEAKPLEYFEAFDLFNKHAFPRNNKIVIRRDLVDDALYYANGFPLALEVLGSFLCSRRENEWESAFNKLDKSPDKTINDVLKLSYNGLEDYATEIFLDIACFFKGRSTKYTTKVLDSCDFDTTIGVQVLVEKSLIIEEEGALQMHDLIQMMGLDIVKQESHDDPGRCSRLWLCDDIRDVLSRDMGTDVVKAIVLHLPNPEEIYIGPNAFTNMRKLRMLIMINVHNSFQGPICLPNELRWFEWPECPQWMPHFSSSPKKLVGMDLHKSNIRVVTEQFKDFKRLRFINFSECWSVVCMPNLDFTPNLEELNLSRCENLELAHESVAHHAKLQVLNLGGCSKLHHLPHVLQSKNLQFLDLSCCSKLQRFPHIPDKIEGLRKLDLDRTSIKELHASIENLVSLERMDLSGCKKLAILPSSIYRFQNLETLRLNGCSKLNKFPKKEEDSSDSHMKTGFPKLDFLDLSGCNLSDVEFLEDQSCFPFLKQLNLSRNNFTNLPTLWLLNNLLSLYVHNCPILQEILNIPRKVWDLQAYGCKSLSKIPSNICDGVDHINLSSCHELIRNGWNINDFFKPEQLIAKASCQVLLSGGEMPKWLLPNKDGYISFMATKDLFEKLLGLAFRVVFEVSENRWAEFNSEALVSGSGIWEDCPRSFSSGDLDQTWLGYHKRDRMWRRDPFGPNDYSQLQFIIKESGGGIVKKCGFRLICKPLENDLKILVQDNQLIDSALIYEVGHEDSQRSIEKQSSNKTEDSLQSKTSTEENSPSKTSKVKLAGRKISRIVKLARRKISWRVHKGSNMADFPVQVCPCVCTLVINTKSLLGVLCVCIMQKLKMLDMRMTLLR